MGCEVYHSLKGVIKAKYGQDAINVGDEGGFAPSILDNKEGLDLLSSAIEKAGYTGKVMMGMDVAASEFYEDGKYNLNFKSKTDKDLRSKEEMAELYTQLCKDYPIVSIEDPFDQDDWEA